MDGQVGACDNMQCDHCSCLSQTLYQLLHICTCSNMGWEHILLRCLLLAISATGQSMSLVCAILSNVCLRHAPTCLEIMHDAGARDIMLLQLWATLFPVSDRRHPVTTPLALLASSYLALCPVTSPHAAAVGKHPSRDNCKQELQQHSTACYPILHVQLHKPCFVQTASKATFGYTVLHNM